MLDRPKQRTYSLRETFETLKVERALRKEARKCGSGAAQQHLSAREDYRDTRNRCNAWHDHKQAEYQQKKSKGPLIQMSQ